MNILLLTILCLPLISSGQSGLNVSTGTGVHNNGYLTIGGESDFHIAMSDIDIQAKSGTGAQYAILYLNFLGGNIRLGGISSNNSLYYDRSLPGWGIGTSDPVTNLHINGNTDASLTSHGLLVLGPTSGPNIVIDQNEIMARNNGQASNLFLNHNGGSIFARGLQNIGDRRNMQFNSSTGELGWDNSSRRDKIRIETLEDDWRKILQARPVQYARPHSENYTEYGYIAEEIDSIGLSTMVGYDSLGRPDDVRYDKMIIYLVEILKIQQKEIDAQQKEIDALRSELMEQPRRTKRKKRRMFLNR